MRLNRTTLPWWFSRQYLNRAPTRKIIPHVGKNERHLLPILWSPGLKIERIVIADRDGEQRRS